jgi:hypothetical protein
MLVSTYKAKRCYNQNSDVYSETCLASRSALAFQNYDPESLVYLTAPSELHVLYNAKRLNVNGKDVAHLWCCCNLQLEGLRKKQISDNTGQDSNLRSMINMVSVLGSEIGSKSYHIHLPTPTFNDDLMLKWQSVVPSSLHPPRCHNRMII